MKRSGMAQGVRLAALSIVLSACAAIGIWVTEQLFFRHLTWIG